MGYNRKTTTYLQPSVMQLLAEAESVDELSAAYLQALKEYDRASSQTKAKWRKYVERKTAALRGETVRP